MINSCFSTITQAKAPPVTTNQLFLPRDPTETHRIRATRPVYLVQHEYRELRAPGSHKFCHSILERARHVARHPLPHWLDQFSWSAKHNFGQERVTCGNLRWSLEAERNGFRNESWNTTASSSSPRRTTRRHLPITRQIRIRGKRERKYTWSSFLCAVNDTIILLRTAITLFGVNTTITL